MTVEINRTVISLNSRGARGVSGAGTVTSATGQSVSTRVLLAAISSPVANQQAVLTEGGREGLFVFDTSNLSSAVSADSRQGIYVAPSSAPTGASGAWVRKPNNNLVTPEMFGAVGDGTTDDYAALQAAIDAVSTRGGEVRLSDKLYRCSQRLKITTAIRLKGSTYLQSSVGSGTSALLGSTIYYDAGVAGLKLAYINDSDASGSPAIYSGATGTIIEGISFRSAGNGASSSGKYGVESRVKFTMRNCEIRGFGDHGLCIRASLTGGDGVVYGNASGCTIDHVSLIGNAGNGLYNSGYDANTQAFNNVVCQGNALGDFLDDAFIPNTYVGCRSETGGSAPYTYKAQRTTGHLYLNCHQEGSTAQLNGFCAVINGSLANQGSHATGYTPFTNANGIVGLAALKAVDYRGTHVVGSSLSSDDHDGTAIAWGESTGYREHKLKWSSNYWTHVYASAIIQMRYPDGNHSTGRNYAYEFPRGIVIGNGGNTPDGKLIQQASAAPTTGTYVQGDIVFSTVPTAGGKIGWVCVTGGTPGTWKAWGVIDA